MAVSSLARYLLPETLKSTSILNPNGSGWSNNYRSNLYTDSNIDSLSNIQTWYPSSPSYPPLHSLKHGFILRLQRFHLLNLPYLSSSYVLDPMSFIVNLKSPSSLSSLQNVKDLVHDILTTLYIPETDPDSLVRHLHSFGCRYKDIARYSLVPLFLDFNITTLLRNEAEAMDWLCVGTIDSVVVETLRATPEAIRVLEKTSFDGSFCKMDKCVVCFEGFEGSNDRVSRLPCSHEFHYPCIEEWLESNHRCPICRYPMPWVRTDFTVEDSTLVLDDSNSESDQSYTWLVPIDIAVEDSNSTLVLDNSHFESDQSHHRIMQTLIITFLVLLLCLLLMFLIRYW